MGICDHYLIIWKYQLSASTESGIYLQFISSVLHGYYLKAGTNKES